MRAALALACCLLSAAAHSQCARLEFAELESLTPEQLLRMRCEYYGSMLEATNAASAASRTSMAAANAMLTRSNGCAVEVSRMDRILARKIPINGSEVAVMDDLFKRCRAIIQPK